VLCHGRGPHRPTARRVVVPRGPTCRTRKIFRVNAAPPISLATRLFPSVHRPCVQRLARRRGVAIACRQRLERLRHAQSRGPAPGSPTRWHGSRRRCVRRRCVPVARSGSPYLFAPFLGLADRHLAAARWRQDWHRQDSCAGAAPQRTRNKCQVTPGGTAAAKGSGLSGASVRLRVDLRHSGSVRYASQVRQRFVCTIAGLLSHSPSQNLPGSSTLACYHLRLCARRARCRRRSSHRRASQHP
jgi:hypothetical protein